MKQLNNNHSRSAGGVWAIRSRHINLQFVSNGNIEAVKQHLAAGTDVNGKNEDDYGVTPLYYATGGGHKEIAELPIIKGADVNAKDDDGVTSLLVRQLTQKQKSPHSSSKKVRM